VAIIVPTLNRAAYLRGCLASLGKLDYRREEFEVVVVDGGSTDETAEVVRQSIDLFSSLRLIVEPKRGSSAARNTGIKIVDSRYIALTDDDAVVDREWLQRLMKEADERTVLVGKVVSYHNGRLQYGCRRSTFLGGSVRLPLGLKNYANRGCTCNMLVPRAVWLDVGGFREDLIEAFDDSTFCLEAQNADYRVRYLEEAVVFHRRDLKRPEKVWPLITYRTYSMLQIYEPTPLRQRIFMCANTAYIAVRALLCLAMFDGKGASESFQAMYRGYKLYENAKNSKNG